MINKLVEKIQKMNAPIVVGLDPMMKFVPEHITKKAFEEYGETLEGAAEASVCHRNDACCVCDLCSISNEFCINVYFANVIDDDCNFISFLIGKNLVHESCFSCSEISAEQCDRCRFLCHDDPLKKSLYL